MAKRPGASRYIRETSATTYLFLFFLWGGMASGLTLGDSICLPPVWFLLLRDPRPAGCHHLMV